MPKILFHDRVQCIMSVILYASLGALVAKTAKKTYFSLHWYAGCTK